MPFSYSHWILLPLFSALVNSALAIFTWSRRRQPASIWFFWITIGLTGWSFSYALNTAATSLPLMNIFFISGVISLCIMLISLVPLVLIFVGHGERFSRLELVLFSAVPSLTILIAVTNDLHGLLRKDMHLVERVGMTLMGYTDGIYWKMVHQPYARLYFLLIVGICIWGMLKRGKIRRKNLAAILLATIVPLVVDLSGLAPTKEFQLTTSTFFITGLCYWVAVLHYQFLQLVPMARKTLLEQMHEPVLVLDRSDRIADFNPSARSYFQLGAESLGQLFHLPEQELQNIGEQVVWHNRASDHWWNLNRTVLQEESEELGWLLVFHDITRIKQAEEKARASGERFRLLTEESADVVWQLDADLRFTYVNAVDHALRGLSAEEVIGTSVFDALALEDAEMIRQANSVRIIQEANGIKTSGMRYELRMLCKDGSFIWTEVHATPLRNKEGEICGYIGITRDISSRKQEDERKDAILQEQSRFLQLVSHEYRTPLAIMQANIDLLDMQATDNRSAPRIKNMRHALERLKEIMDHSMVSARFSDLCAEQHTEGIDLVSFLDRLIDSAEGLWPGRSFIFLPDDNPVQVTGSTLHLRTALLNLLDNACKYSPPDRPVTLEAIADTTTAVITISDQGRGLALTDADSVFEKFQRGSNSSGTSGAGLGLWLVQQIIRQHGGSISLESAPGSGTRVIILLPLSSCRHYQNSLVAF